MIKFQTKLTLVVVMLAVVCMLVTGCANNKKMAFDYNLETLRQNALNSNGSAFFRQSGGFFAHVGGKDVGIINASTDKCWEELVKIMRDKDQLTDIYQRVSFFHSLDIIDQDDNSVTIRFTAGVHPVVNFPFSTASVDMVFDLNSLTKKVSGRTIRGSFTAFPLSKKCYHDIALIPIDDNKTLMVVWVDGKAKFPFNITAGMGSALIGVSDSLIPTMSSAWIQAVREGLWIIM